MCREGIIQTSSHLSELVCAVRNNLILITMFSRSKTVIYIILSAIEKNLNWSAITNLSARRMVGLFLNLSARRMVGLFLKLSARRMVGLFLNLSGRVMVGLFLNLSCIRIVGLFLNLSVIRMVGLFLNLSARRMVGLFLNCTVILFFIQRQMFILQPSNFYK